MTNPGLLENFYLSGVNLVRNPDTFSMTFPLAETRQRARDMTLLVHRGAPYTGCQLRPSKAAFTFGWTTMAGADIDTVNDVISFGGPLDLAIWRPITEAFSSYAGGTLARQSALAVVSPLPPSASTLYALVGKQGSTTLSVSLGSADSFYRTPWTATGGSGTAIPFIRYYPAFRVYVAEGQPTFSKPFSQGQTLNLEEA